MAIIISIALFEKVFIVWELILLVDVGIEIRAIIISIMIFLFFFVFLFSFGDIDAVYINRVIIPDEKVRIVTKAIHLDMVILKMAKVLIKDKHKTEIDKKIGFKFLINFAVNNDASIRISCDSFDLQNQCSLNYKEFFFSYFCFFLVLV